MFDWSIFFNSKTVLLVGGSGFVGSALAKEFLKAKAIVLVIDLRPSRFLTMPEQEMIEFYEVDLENTSSTNSALQKIVENHDVDILINLAAMTKSHAEAVGVNYFADFVDADERIENSALRVGLGSYIASCRIVGRSMISRNEGVILNFASDVGVIAPNDTIYQADRYGYTGVEFSTPTIYAVSKAAVIHLTKTLSTKWAKKGVRVNSISPAGIERDQSLHFKQKLSDLIPIGRMMYIEELIGPSLFLTSDLSTYVIGQNMLVDGGRSVW